MHQYESLDFETKEDFNKKFLRQLELKGGISVSEVLEQHVDADDTESVVEAIFPPDQYGDYNRALSR